MAGSLKETLRKLDQKRSYPNYLSVVQALKSESTEKQDNEEYKIAFLGNITLDLIEPVILAEASALGIIPRSYKGGFDNALPEVLNPESAFHSFNANLIISGFWLESLAPSLANRYISLNDQERSDEINRVISTIRDFIRAIRKKSSSPVLLNNFIPPTATTLGILDSQMEQGHFGLVRKLNAELLKIAKDNADVYIVDWERIALRIGTENAIDLRYWQIGRAPLSRHIMIPLGIEYGRFIRALNGKSRKCLVLDCDNTLWGGIVGEDGLEGIKLGDTYPGSCFRDFQQQVLNLHDRGVILALCSKNNEEDVLEVLREHPEMILREKHFATWQINWNNKAENLQRIAQDLNIGIESLLFVDDNEFECNLVRDQLPEVAVLHMHGDTSSFANRLVEGGYFDSLSYSNEDKKRTQMYKADINRKTEYETSTSLEEYLEKLELVATIGFPDELKLPRVAQLTQKTNQFNLTTRRYTLDDIRSFSKDEDSDVFFAHLQDKYSELGIIGVVILKYEDELAIIDSFMLSCRALGRGMEKSLLINVIRHVKEKGYTRIRGEYLPTAKNAQVEKFYPMAGFSEISSDNGHQTWEFDLNNDLPEEPGWIRVKYFEEKANA